MLWGRRSPRSFALTVSVVPPTSGDELSSQARIWPSRSRLKWKRLSLTAGHDARNGRDVFAKLAVGRPHRTTQKCCGGHAGRSRLPNILNRILAAAGRFHPHQSGFGLPCGHQRVAPTSTSRLTRAAIQRHVRDGAVLAPPDPDQTDSSTVDQRPQAGNRNLPLDDLGAAFRLILMGFGGIVPEIRMRSPLVSRKVSPSVT